MEQVWRRSRLGGFEEMHKSEEDVMDKGGELVVD
jgi:hypothetical protein